MDKESIYELQKIDCNCNDCIFMERDFDKFKKWEEWNKVLQETEFEQKRTEAFRIANECEDEKGKKSLLFIANKLRFIFDRSSLINYGNCAKLNKSVSFIPNNCCPENRDCFEHRKKSY